MHMTPASKLRNQARANPTLYETHGNIHDDEKDNAIWDHGCYFTVFFFFCLIDKKGSLIIFSDNNILGAQVPDG